MGFNPCSNGITTRDLSVEVSGLSSPSGFNPCSNGITTRESAARGRCVLGACRFNPCSNGITTRDVENPPDTIDALCVSILVLMELLREIYVKG